MTSNTIKLGQKVRDIVTGFEGIALSRVEYLNGCVQYLVKPSAKDGAMVPGEYLDWQQLEIIEGGINIQGLGTGGPSTNAPKGFGMGRN